MANHGFLESRAQKSCFKKGRGKHNLARPIARRRQPPTSPHHRSRYDAPPPSARLQGNIDLRPPRPAAASPATPSPVSGWASFPPNSLLALNVRLLRSMFCLLSSFFGRSPKCLCAFSCCFSPYISFMCPSGLPLSSFFLFLLQVYLIKG